MLTPTPKSGIDSAPALQPTPAQHLKPPLIYTEPAAVFYLPYTSARTETLLPGEILYDPAPNLIKSICPAWPVPYLLTVSFCSSHSFSVAIIDKYASSIQVNLHFLKDEYEGCVLLGGSSRISPSDEKKYGVRPSELSADWLKSQVFGWLEWNQQSKLFVRAHFQGVSSGGTANQYFTSLGFTPSTELGVPYMERRLQTTDTPITGPLSERVRYYDHPYDENGAHFLRTYLAMRTMELEYFKKVRAAESTIEKEAAFQEVESKYEGVSDRHFYFFLLNAYSLGKYISQPND